MKLFKMFGLSQFQMKVFICVKKCVKFVIYAFHFTKPKNVHVMIPPRENSETMSVRVCFEYRIFFDKKMKF